MNSTSSEPRSFSAPLIALMAVACGLAVGNLYYCQPLLVSIQSDLHETPARAGLIPTLTQLGYATGMLLVVPLGDILERRRLMVAMQAAVALALIGAARAQSLAGLVVASFGIGLTTLVAHVLLPFVGQSAPAGQRGRAVGTLMSGTLLGILLARTISGFVGGQFGWRAMYWLAAIVAGGLGLVLRLAMPESRPALSIS